MSALFSPVLAFFLGLAIPSAAVPPGQTPADAVPVAQKIPAVSIEVEGYQPHNNLFLERGRKSTVLVKSLAEPVPGARLRVTYRPTSAVEQIEDAGAFEDGQIIWTPGQAGLARLEAVLIKKDDKGKDKITVLATRVVSIRPGPGFPLGLLLMCIAGAILFLGAFMSIRALLRG